MCSLFIFIQKLLNCSIKNNLQKWLFAWNPFKVIQFILFFLLFGCQESTEEKSHAPRTFNSINAQKQFDSKSTKKQWEFVLEIVSNSKKEDTLNFVLKKNVEKLV